MLTKHLLIACLFLVCSSAQVSAESPTPKTAKAIQPNEIAIIVNDNSSLSRQIGEYYQTARNIPDSNIIHIALPTQKTHILPETFIEQFEKVKKLTPDTVQAYALTWIQPFRVGCMSITSAFTFGYDETLCAKKPAGRNCGPTAQNPFYLSKSLQPWTDHKIRPSMIIAGSSLAKARQLIDRGVEADGSHPDGTAYLLSTSDPARNVRARYFNDVKQQFKHRLSTEVLQQDALENKQDVMFYFTGMQRVEKLDTLKFKPGAIADHLTSFGGNLKRAGQRGQMSILRWLEAGATGSYGTVVEPCNFIEKFPAPTFLLRFYLGGESLLYAYWKSVQWPVEGVFIGEPLATPYK